MAGFSLDVGDLGASSAQFVSAPTSNTTSVAAQGITNIANGLFGLADARDRADAAAQAAERAAKPTEAQTNRAAYGAFTSSLQELQGIEDPASINTKLGAIVAAYEGQGFSIGVEEQAAILRYTGTDINVIDPLDAARNTINETLGANPQYIMLARRNLETTKASTGQDFTESDIITQAMTIYENDQADTVYLATAKNISSNEFQTTFAPRANRLVSSLVDVALQGMQVEASGGNVSVESLTALRANISALESQITRPLNVSAEDYGPIQAQVDGLKGLVEQLINFDQQNLDLQATRMLQAATQVMLDKSREDGDTNLAIAAAALTTTEGRSLFFTNNAAAITSALTNSKPAVRNAIGSNNEQSAMLDFSGFTLALTGVVEPSVDTTLDTTVTTPPTNISEMLDLNSEALHDPSYWDRVQDFTSADRVNLIDVVNGLTVAALSPKAMDDPSARSSFVGGVGQITATITSTDRLLDPTYLSKVFSNDFFSTMDKLKVVDQEAYNMSQARVQNALLRQFNNLTTTYSARLAGNSLTVSPTGDISISETSTKFSRGERNALRGFADQLYNGSLVDMMADRGRKIENVNARSWATALQQDYLKVKDFGLATRAMSRTLRRAGLDTRVLQITLDQSVEGAAPASRQVLSNEAISTTATNAINLSEGGIATNQLTTQGAAAAPFEVQWGVDDAAAYNSIPAGSYYTDPNGILRVKG